MFLSNLLHWNKPFEPIIGTSIVGELVPKNSNVKADEIRSLAERVDKLSNNDGCSTSADGNFLWKQLTEAKGTLLPFNEKVLVPFFKDVTSPFPHIQKLDYGNLTPQQVSLQAKKEVHWSEISGKFEKDAPHVDLQELAKRIANTYPESKPGARMEMLRYDALDKNLDFLTRDERRAIDEVIRPKFFCQVPKFSWEHKPHSEEVFKDEKNDIHATLHSEKYISDVSAPNAKEVSFALRARPTMLTVEGPPGATLTIFENYKIKGKGDKGKEVSKDTEPALAFQKVFPESGILEYEAPQAKYGDFPYQQAVFITKDDDGAGPKPPHLVAKFAMETPVPYWKYLTVPVEPEWVEHSGTSFDQSVERDRWEAVNRGGRGEWDGRGPGVERKPRESLTNVPNLKKVMMPINVDSQ